uniref:Uncharacterized protein n=1 Tax=Anguilla anguilla TaxID=7936 RepID=A0A0E9TSB2_ANGAN
MSKKIYNAAMLINSIFCKHLMKCFTKHALFPLI